MTVAPAVQAGDWRPTPPAFAPMLVPWLSRVTPFTLNSPDQYRPGPPPAIASPTYTAEFNEVKAYGAKFGSSRDFTQTQTATPTPPPTPSGSH